MKGNNLLKSNVNLFLTTVLLTSLIFIIGSSCSAAETTKIGVVPSTESVFVGDEFNLTIYIDPTEEIGGWLLDLSFTPGMINANNVTAGSYWTTFFDEGNVSNDLGMITGMQTWSKGPYPIVNHTACVVNFTALELGVCTINIERAQATDTLFGIIAVSTYNATIIIIGEDTPANDGDGDGGIPPMANASASEKIGYIGTPVSFDSSLSSDSDGTIDLYEWDWNDDGIYDHNSTSATATHTFDEVGNYSVTLRVTDNLGATDTDTIVVVISKPNIPPTKPTIDGPQEGTKGTEYSYSFRSTDADNDTIKYIVTWGDGETTTTDFLPNGTATIQNHSWISAGKYILAVQADDNETVSSTTQTTILIDAHLVEDIGYLIDDDADETYDSFHNDASGQETDVGKQDDGTYLIDSDGDGEWDYVYDIETDTLTEYSEPTPEPDNTALIVLAIIVILFLIILGYLVKRSNDKKKAQKKAAEKKSQPKKKTTSKKSKK